MQSMAMAQSPEEHSDELLADLALTGDTNAFALLVAKYRDIAYAYAYAHLRHRDEAEDIVQEAFVRAFVGLPHIKSSRCWAAWLMKIVRNLCHDASRRKAGRNATPLDEAWPARSAEGSPQELLRKPGEKATQSPQWYSLVVYSPTTVRISLSELIDLMQTKLNVMTGTSHRASGGR